MRKTPVVSRADSRAVQPLRMRRDNLTFHCYGLYHWTLSTLVPALTFTGGGVGGGEVGNASAPMLATAVVPLVSGNNAELAPGDDWVDACFLRHTAPWVVGYCIAYSAVFVVGIVGNCCVLKVVSQNTSMKNSAFHALLVNLAVADLMVIVFCLPVTLVGHLFGRKSPSFFISFTLL